MKDEKIIEIIKTIDWHKESAFETLIERIKENEKV